MTKAEEKGNNMLIGGISFAMQCAGKKEADIAPVLGVSPRTYTNRKNKPGDFTLDELRVIFRVCNMTDDQILKIIGRRKK